MYKITLSIDTLNCTVTATTKKIGGDCGPTVTMYYPRSSKAVILEDGTFITEGKDDFKVFCPTINYNGGLTTITMERLE